MEKPTLMIVDDEASVLKSLNRLLSDEGFEIISAQNGELALSLLEVHNIDLIISDQRMPYMSGVEFLTVVREQWPDIISMMLTAYADIDTAIRAINDIGVYKFILKPWNDDDLKLTLRKAAQFACFIKEKGISESPVFKSGSIRPLEPRPAEYRDPGCASGVPDPLLDKAIQEGMTDSVNVSELSGVPAFDKNEFDRLDYTAAQLQGIYLKQDKQMQRKIKGHALEVYYRPELRSLIGIGQKKMTSKDTINVYKYVFRKLGLI